MNVVDVGSSVMPDAVVLNEEVGRFELDVDGHTAFLTFRRDDDRLTLIHTEVPEALGGRGVGSALVKGVLQHARDNELTVIPSCPFVRSYLERHPDEAAGLRVES
jgi:predicted GNAT family acetyltransferase